jgi:hypothetical protein
MKFREWFFCNEVFDQSAPYKWINASQEAARAEFNVNDKRYAVVFINDSGMWEVDFFKIGDADGHGITGTGNASQVFATVMRVVQDFKNKYKSPPLTFAANNMEPSRIKLYDKMIKRYAPEMGYNDVSKSQVKADDDSSYSVWTGVDQ